MPGARAWLLALVAGTGCTGATIGSGVGDTLLERPPYYAGRIMPADSAAIGHVPITYQRGATQAAIFDPAEGAGTPVAALLAEMNAYLDSLGVTVRVTAGRQRGVPPDVQFSCETDPSGDCAIDEERALGRDDIVMRLAVGRPSDEWAAWAGGLVDSAGVAAVVAITLEVGQYRVRQRGLRGDKEVELGTAHTVNLPWLTSLETPVSVLQLTGALVGRDGRAIRIGAEGIVARRTRLTVSAVGGQELLSDEDVAAVRTYRRDDLPNSPPAWRVALRNLVAGLTGATLR
jgi:hypothetical protein